MQTFVKIPADSSTLYINTKDIKCLEVVKHEADLYSLNVIYYGDEAMLVSNSKMSRETVDALVGTFIVGHLQKEAKVPMLSEIKDKPL